MNAAPPDAAPPPAPSIYARLLTAALLYGGIVYWSSGVKNAVVWGALLVVLVQAARGRRRLHGGGLAIPLAALLLSALASTAFSIDRAFSISNVLKLLELLAGYLVLANVLPPGRRVERAVEGWTWAMGGVALTDAIRLGRAALAGGPVLEHGRWFDSMLGYPTIAAGLYAATVVLAVAQILGAETRARRWTAGALAAAFFVMLYLLQTRSVLLGIAAGLVPVALLSTVTLRARAGAALLVAAALAAMLALPGAFRERLLAGASSDRAALWQDTRRLLDEGIAREPVRAWVGFGHGHTIFQRLHRELPRRQRAAERVYDHAHNLVLELRVQGGYLAVLAWTALLLTAGAVVVRRPPARDPPDRRPIAGGLAGALLCLLVYGQFSVLLALQPILLFWSLLGTLMAACVHDWKSRGRCARVTLRTTPGEESP